MGNCHEGVSYFDANPVVNISGGTGASQQLRKNLRGRIYLDARITAAKWQRKV